MFRLNPLPRPVHLAMLIGFGCFGLQVPAQAQSIDLSRSLDPSARYLAHSDEPVAKLAQCAAQIGNASMSMSAAEKRSAEERVSRLVAMLGPVADKTAVPRDRAAAVLAYRLMPMTLTSIMQVPNAGVAASVSSDCIAIADDPQAFIDGLTGN